MEFLKLYNRELPANVVRVPRIHTDAVIVYPSPIEVADKETLLSLLDDVNYQTEVHFLVDHNGVYQLNQSNLALTHSGTFKGNNTSMAIMLVEPLHNDPDATAKRLRTIANLRTFLSHPMFTDDMAILSVGSAAKYDYIGEKTLKFYEDHAHYFMNSLLGQSYEQECSFNNDIIDFVIDTAGRVDTIIEQIEADPMIENESDERIMRPAIFVGGCLYKTRGASTKLTSTGDMHLVAVIHRSAKNSKHPYEVMFLDGQRYWVNKTALILENL